MGQLAFDLLPREVSPPNEWCQRWRDRRPRWRHRSEGGFDAARYEVAPLGDRTARAYVERHHYAASYVASRLRYGLWGRHGALLGVAVLSVPVRKEVLTGPFPELVPFSESLELGRFVLADAVPVNGESWFLAQVFRLARREGVRGVVSFSDPVARRDATGNVVFPGHIGVIYQASNAHYAGRGTPRTLLVLPDGRVLNERALAKLRSLDSGHAYVEALLRSHRSKESGWAGTRRSLARRTIAAASYVHCATRRAGCAPYPARNCHAWPRCSGHDASGGAQGDCGTDPALPRRTGWVARESPGCPVGARGGQEPRGRGGPASVRHGTGRYRNARARD